MLLLQKRQDLNVMLGMHFYIHSFVRSFFGHNKCNKLVVLDSMGRVCIAECEFAVGGFTVTVSNECAPLTVAGRLAVWREVSKNVIRICYAFRLQNDLRDQG